MLGEAKTHSYIHHVVKVNINNKNKGYVKSRKKKNSKKVQT